MHFLRKASQSLACAGLIATLMAAAGGANAATLWYNGDFNGNNCLSNESNTLISDGRTFDDFTVGAGGWNVNDIWSNNMMDFSGVTTAEWTIRSGVSLGNGGTIIASGTSAATQTATGRSGFGYTEYTIDVSGLNINLGAGTYWLQVTPIGTGSGRSFLSTTSGANSIGSPSGNNGNSFLDSSYFGQNFADANGFVSGNPSDFSEGIGGTANNAAVPEPSQTATLGFGVLGLAGLLLAARKRKANAMS